MTVTFKGKRCVVFGADGYLGRHLVNELLNTGNMVVAYGIAETSPIREVNYKCADICDPAAMQLVDWNVDCIFMFAGLTGTYDGFNRADQFVSVNEIGLLNVLGSIRNSGFRPRVVFPSTRLVYRGSDHPLAENASTDAKTIYAINKLACEQMLEAYRNSFDIDYTVYRICVPYGNAIGTAYSYGTLGAFLGQAQNTGVIKLYGNGSLRRTFTHVNDLCRQILSTCLSIETRNLILNTAGEAASLGEIAALICAQYAAKIEFAEWPEKDLKIESGHTVFDSSRLEKICPQPVKTRIAEWIAQADSERFDS